MPVIEGRGIRRPIVGEVFMGETVVLRIDDQDNPEFWLTIQFTAQEFGELLTRFSDWLQACRAHVALDALWLEK